MVAPSKADSYLPFIPGKRVWIDIEDDEDGPEAWEKLKKYRVKEFEKNFLVQSLLHAISKHNGRTNERSEKTFFNALYSIFVKFEESKKDLQPITEERIREEREKSVILMLGAKNRLNKDKEANKNIPLFLSPPKPVIEIIGKFFLFSEVSKEELDKLKSKKESNPEQSFKCTIF